MVTLNGAMQHAVLPLQDIVRLCSLPRVPGANSTFQAAITYDDEGTTVTSPAGGDGVLKRWHSLRASCRLDQACP